MLQGRGLLAIYIESLPGIWCVDSLPLANITSLKLIDAQCTLIVISSAPSWRAAAGGDTDQYSVDRSPALSMSRCT